MEPFEEAGLLAQSLAAESAFYTTAVDHQLRLLESFRAGKQPGESTYYQSLDEMLTWRPGFLYCFTGWPGGGKTEVLTQMSVLQAAMKGRKIALYSPESYPIDEYIDSFIQCYLGKTTDKRFGQSVCSEREYIDGIKWVDDSFFFCDWEETPTVDVLLRAFDHLYKEGCRIFIVDPFNSVSTDGEDRNIAVALKKNLTAFKRFAAQKRVMVWLVEHPKTPTDPKDFDQVPTNRHLFGGTMWWNKIDVGVTVHRPNREDKFDRTVLIKTWKIKRQQLNGRPGEGYLYFDIKSNRYYSDNNCSVHPMIMPDMYADREQQPF
jgi:twinkle protein